MKLDFLVKRRFEVMFAASALALGFVLVVWAVMVILKAINPVVFHFNLLMDILPWFTPVLIIGLLAGPLYWKVAGLLAPPHGSLQRLASARYQLVWGAFFYLLIYTMAVWGAMVLLRIWDVQDFHYNLVVDWLPAILPPWMMWILGAPMVYKSLAAMDMSRTVPRRKMSNWTSVGVGFVLGGGLLTFGGLILNEAVYSGSQGGTLAVQQDLTAFGILLFSAGGLFWALMLAVLYLGWRPVEGISPLTRPLDRFRLERPRIVSQSFVLSNLLIGACGVMMVAAQYLNAQDFHFYMAKDIWGFGLPIMGGFAIFAAVAYGVPAFLAVHDSGSFAPGAGVAEGPSGPSGSEGWGYSAADLLPAQQG